MIVQPVLAGTARIVLRRWGSESGGLLACRLRTVGRASRVLRRRATAQTLELRPAVLGAVIKRRFATGLAKYAFNPIVRTLSGSAIPVPGTVDPRDLGSAELRPPAPNAGDDGLDGDTFWIVAEHGRRAAYVLNIEANPRVRVADRPALASRAAAVLPDDDPQARLKAIGSNADGGRP